MLLMYPNGTKPNIRKYFSYKTDNRLWTGIRKQPTNENFSTEFRSKVETFSIFVTIFRLSISAEVETTAPSPVLILLVRQAAVAFTIVCCKKEVEFLLVM